MLKVKINMKKQNIQKYRGILNNFYNGDNNMEIAFTNSKSQRYAMLSLS